MLEIMKRVVFYCSVFVLLFLVALGRENTALAAGAQDIITALSDVTAAQGYKYGVKDSTGSSMGTLKIIENSAGGYIGVYHTLVNGTFFVKLAVSTDMLTWTFKKDLETHAHQPTIFQVSDGSYIVAYEIDSGGATPCTGVGGTSGNCMRFRHYANLTALLSGTADRTFQSQRTLSNCAEGTPNIYSVTLNPDIDHSVIDLGFHYFRNCDVDRQARGTLTNFSSWTSRIEINLNTAFESLTNPGIGGNVGDRDNIVYQGSVYTLHEAQYGKNDWTSWRPYLYDWQQQKLSLLTIKTHKGSLSFANPTVTSVVSPAGKQAIVATYFIPTQGAAAEEGGTLLFYKELASAAVTPEPTAPAGTTFTFAAAGDFGKSANSDSALSGIKNAGTAFTLAIGDFSYNVVTPTNWGTYVKSIVGDTYPFQLVTGNHDAADMPTYVASLPNRIPRIVGTYGQEYYFDYPTGNPLARVILASPGEFGFSYAPGTAHYTFVTNAIDEARSKGIRWIVLGVHKSCISIGTLGCDSGADIMNLAINKKIDVMLTGHEHNYQRSKQLALRPSSCSAIATMSYNSTCVVDDGADGVYTKGAGTVIVIQGTGGRGLFNVNTTHPLSGYFAAYMPVNGNNTWGFGKYTVSSTELSMQFVPTSGAGFSDQFTIRSPDIPTSTPAASGINIASTVFLHGIGKAGDNVNPSSIGTNNPLHPQRTMSVELYNSTEQLVKTVQGTVNFNATSGAFEGVVSAGTIASGVYIAKVSSPMYLKKSVPGIISVTTGQSVQLPAISLITGDSNNDNTLSILDYNLLLDCFSDLSPARNCAELAKKAAADFTDDGNVNQFDYNLFLRELSVQSGQ